MPCPSNRGSTSVCVNTTVRADRVVHREADDAHRRATRASNRCSSGASLTCTSVMTSMVGHRRAPRDRARMTHWRHAPAVPRRADASRGPRVLRRRACSRGCPCRWSASASCSWSRRCTGPTGSPARVSAVYVIAQAICSPQLARLVDRHGQARIMRPAVAIAAFGLVGLVVAATARGARRRSCTSARWSPAPASGRSGRWSGPAGPRVLGADPHRMHTAYSLESALDELVFIVGPVLATVLATGVAPTAGLVVPLVAMLVGGYWFLSLRRHRAATRARRVSPRPRGSVLRKPGMVGAGRRVRRDGLDLRRHGRRRRSRSPTSPAPRAWPA